MRMVCIAVVVEPADNIPEVIWRNAVKLTVIGRIKSRVCSVYVDTPVMGLYLQKIKFLYSSYLTVIRFVYDSSFYLILYESSLKALIFVNTARFCYPWTRKSQLRLFWLHFIIFSGPSAYIQYEGMANDRFGLVIRSAVEFVPYSVQYKSFFITP